MGDKSKTIKLAVVGHGARARRQVLKIVPITNYFRGNERSVLFDYLRPRGASLTTKRWAIAKRIKRLDALPEGVDFLLLLGSDQESSAIVWRYGRYLMLADSARIPRYEPFFWIVVSVGEEPIK